MNLGRHAPLRAAVSTRQLSAHSHARLPSAPRSQLILDRAHIVGGTSVLEFPRSHQCPPLLAVSRHRKAPNGPRTSVAQAGTATSKPFQLLIPCSASNSRQQSARMFMLQCRTRNHPISTRKPSMQIGSPMRYYSSTAEAELESTEITTTGTSRSWEPAHAEASMVNIKGELPRLELRLVRDPSLETELLENDDQVQKNRTIVHEIGVPETRGLSRAVRTEYGVVKGERTRRAVELQMRQNGPPIFWHHVLKRLEKFTYPMPVEQSSLTVYGSELEIIELYYTLHSDPTYNVVLDYPVGAEGQFSMLVVGTETNIQDVVKLVDKDEEWQRLGTKSFYRFQSDDARRTLGITPSVRGSANSRYPLPLDAIYPPKAWSRKRLAEYVRAITTSRPPQILHQGFHHRDVVEKILGDVLYNQPDLRPNLSWPALHEALSFLIKHEKIREAKHLLGHMERNGFMASAETFNIFLRGCARQQNMPAFSHYLNLMVQEDIAPNEGSWIALMLGAPTVEAQKETARQMFNRGFEVKPTFARENAPQIVTYSFGPFLDAGGTIADYIKTLADLYGPNWIHAATVDEMVATLAARGRFIAAIELIRELALEWEYKPTNRNVHILLRHCARHANADVAIWIVVYFHRTWKTNTTDHIILELLFDIAWKSHMYNVTRTVWKYTNAFGEATFKMRHEIYDSLTERMKPNPGTVTSIWESSAGSVACGADPLAKSNRTPQMILNMDKRLYGRKPRFDFTFKLVEALFMDKEWSTDAVKKTRGVTWKVRNAIQIPFRPMAFKLRKLLGDPKLEGLKERRGRIRHFRRDPASGRLYQHKESVMEYSVAEELTAEEPAVEEPAVEEPAVEEPAVEEPAVEEPAVEEPVVEEPAAEEPAAEEPAAEESVAEEPATGESKGT